MRPNSKRCKLYIYGELQKILDLFHPSVARFAKVRIAKFNQKTEFRGRQVWHAFKSTILILHRSHLLSNWAHIFCGLFLCAPCWKKIYIKSISEKKRLKKKKNSEWKDKKRGAHKQQPIALFICGFFCLVLVCCYLSYLFPSLFIINWC